MSFNYKITSFIIMSKNLSVFEIFNILQIYLLNVFAFILIFIWVLILKMIIIILIICML